jgi:regulator of protease activity HflC (stomatin/prohibitin superfamily)
MGELDTATLVTGTLWGLVAWFFVRHMIFGFFTVQQNERAVLTTFGRAKRIGGASTAFAPGSEDLRDDERLRYRYPQVEVLGPGLRWKWPWQKVHKVSIATQTINMAHDLEDPSANHGGQMLEAVTKDQLNVGLTGQIRYRVSEQNLYAYLFGVKRPIVHVMGFFVSILRERIANFEARSKLPVPEVPALEPGKALAVLGGNQSLQAVAGVSINDLRKNLRDLNEHMDKECAASTARYGIALDATLITGIDPPHEVESALAAINTAHNQVSSDISLAQAAADQKIVSSRRAVEIETLKAQAEVEPLRALAGQLKILKSSGGDAIPIYVKNARLSLLAKADRILTEVKS